MVINGFSNYSSLGLGAVGKQGPHTYARQSLTLDASLDPKTPNEYAVHIAPPVVEPPQKATEAKHTSKKLNHNNDPVSRAFISVATYKSITHEVNIFI